MASQHRLLRGAVLSMLTSASTRLQPGVRGATTFENTHRAGSAVPYLENPMHTMGLGPSDTHGFRHSTTRPRSPAANPSLSIRKSYPETSYPGMHTSKEPASLKCRPPFHSRIKTLELLRHRVPDETSEYHRRQSQRESPDFGPTASAKILDFVRPAAVTAWTTRFLDTFLEKAVCISRASSTLSLIGQGPDR